MTFTPAFLDELRARTSLSALIGTTVALRKAGREQKGCCPFHTEKTPSFHVNDDKGFYHCFGCSAHGDAIRWLTDQRGLSFIDAVKELAAAAGMEVPAPVRRAGRQDAPARNLHDALADAAAWYADRLLGDGGREGRVLLTRRGVDGTTARAFGLGLAASSPRALRTALSQYGDAALIAAGLLVAPDGREPYDRFRNRLIFPIRDPRGRVIAFGGRIMGEGEPKYLNSPDTPTFDKGRTLYNLDRAAPAARRSGRMLVVEGYMDVIGLAVAGIEEVVAPLGTALTEAQLDRLWRMINVPTLCFDGDAAGRAAGVRAAIRALPALRADRSLRFAMLPPGQDPDDLARTGGAAAIERVLGGARPLVDILWEHERDAVPLDTPEARAGLHQRIAGHIAAIRDGRVAAEYERELRARLRGLFWREGLSDRRRAKRRKETFLPAGYDAAARIARKTATALLRGLARYPAVLHCEIETICRLTFDAADHRAALEELVAAAFAGTPVDPVDFDQRFPDESGWRSLGFAWFRPDIAAPAAEAALRDLLDHLTSSAWEVGSAPTPKSGNGDPAQGLQLA